MTQHFFEDQGHTCACKVRIPSIMMDLLYLPIQNMVHLAMNNQLPSFSRQHIAVVAGVINDPQVVSS